MSGDDRWYVWKCILEFGGLLFTNRKTSRGQKAILDNPDLETNLLVSCQNSTEEFKTQELVLAGIIWPLYSSPIHFYTPFTFRIWLFPESCIKVSLLYHIVYHCYDTLYAKNGNAIKKPPYTYCTINLVMIILGFRVALKVLILNYRSFRTSSVNFLGLPDPFTQSRTKFFSLASVAANSQPIKIHPTAQEWLNSLLLTFSYRQTVAVGLSSIESSLHFFPASGFPFLPPYTTTKPTFSVGYQSFNNKQTFNSCIIQILKPHNFTRGHKICLRILYLYFLSICIQTLVWTHSQKQEASHQDPLYWFSQMSA